MLSTQNITDCKIVTLPIFVVNVDSLDQDGKCDLVAAKEGDPGAGMSTMDSVLSLDDGSWSRPADESCPPLLNGSVDSHFQSLNIRQPSPPPVLAQVQPEYAHIPPSKVADPRPGPANSSPDSPLGPAAYQHLHIVSAPVLLKVHVVLCFS